VPNVLGKQLGRAKQLIRKAYCSVGRMRHGRSKRKFRGKVIGQNPRAGSVRRRGYPVNLIVGRGGIR
jgi:beta-lactam-binding protein with PASTA domain